MLSLKIAQRFLSSNKAQTVLISIGIAVGVSVQIFIGSLISGLQISLIDTTVGSSSHITISNKEKGSTISEWKEVDTNVRKIYDIKYVSPVLNYNAFINNNENKYSVLLRGFNLDDANKIYKFEKNLISGRMPLNENEIIIGTNLKKDANLELNKSYKIFTPAGSNYSIKVVGVYDLGVSSINNLWIISNLKTVQSISNVEDKITAIEMQVEDVFSADKVAKMINIKENDSLKITNWKDENESLLSGLKGQSISSIMIQVFVLISVILGIASVLIISVVQKSKQIGILKAMGIKDKMASMIFLAQGSILGVLGATIGVILGLGLSIAFTKFALNPDGTPVIDLFIDPMFILISWLIAVISSVIASFIPSRKSSKLSPMEVIKNA